MAKVALLLTGIIIGLTGLITLAFYIVTIFAHSAPIEMRMFYELIVATCIASTAFLGFLFIPRQGKHRN
ncbi:MAG: hypothetical protein GX799_10775 [Crenarchaeota archaeon]|nr:hypothetical protein [Thermoproteota archaeon]